MRKICIGIPVHAEPGRLKATITNVYSHTPCEFELVLLPDGPDGPTRQALGTLRSLRQIETNEPRGMASCFNRLLAIDADIYILLESGSIVAPHWLDHILAALDADPHHGLAGPSTNRVWNEQCAFPHALGSSTAIERTAQEVARRAGTPWQTLEPLYSLADFCYVVRREVVEAIGAADEGYGLGPCWEMDYNIRAARAGWRGVWARRAYVYRSPFTERRRREEQLRFEASKQRYQDKFCALRLLNQRAGYQPHCRGDACEHFAPRDQIQIQLPIARPQSPPQPALRQPAGSLPLPPASETVSPVIHDAAPLVTCIMPTRDRADLALQAVRYFQEQDYAARELVIVDDGDDDLERRLPDDPRIRHLRVQRGSSIGDKRNRACAVARGSLIAHWDDDDWYAPQRLSTQIAPLLAGAADLTGLDAGIFFELPRWEFWTCTPDLHRRLFVGNVHGGTLVYRRRLWEKGARYPDRSLAEDAAFLQKALRSGARLSRIENTGLFIYIRHSNNSWAFRCGEYLDPRGWRRTAEPPLPPAHRAFYASRAPLASESPLVSCIMPTADRRPFVARAIQYFSRQGYARRELIVVDDGEDAIQDLIPPDPRIRYLRLNRRVSLGSKRNLACRESQGQVIVHWDDDDWMASWRLGYQVENLLKQGADVCGLAQLLYYDVNSGQAWQYAYTGGRPWVSGNTLCYFKRFWHTNPFPEINVGEDTRFVWSNRQKQIIALPDETFYLSLIHSRNTSPKTPRGAFWRPYPVDQVRRLVGDDWTALAAPAQTSHSRGAVS